MTRRTPASRAATSTFNVALTQFTLVATGSATERGTEASAASWKTTSTPSHARAQVAASARSPSMNSIASRPARLFRLPVMKLSIPRTDSPRASKAAAMERPIKPPAPVTRYFAKSRSPSGVNRRRGTPQFKSTPAAPAFPGQSLIPWSVPVCASRARHALDEGVIQSCFRTLKRTTVMADV